MTVKEEVETPEVENETPTEEKTEPAAEKTLKEKIEASGAGNEEIPAKFTPSYKFKAAGEEREIPEFLRPAIRDEYTQKQLIELHEKAYGLETTKKKHDELQDVYKKADTENKQLNQFLDAVYTTYEKGDFEQFFKLTNLQKEKFLQWVVGQVEYNQLPPEQKMLVDRERDVKSLRENSETYSQRMTAQLQNEVRQRKQYEIDLALTQPDVAGFVGQFDSLPGRKSGDFREELRREGELEYYRSGMDLPAGEAAKRVLQRYSGFSPVASGVVPSVGVKASGQQKQKVIIPNVEETNSSPVEGKQPGSIAELKKMRDAMMARA